MGNSAPAKSSLIRERLKVLTSAECLKIAERKMGEGLIPISEDCEYMSLRDLGGDKCRPWIDTTLSTSKFLGNRPTRRPMQTALSALFAAPEDRNQIRQRVKEATLFRRQNFGQADLGASPAQDIRDDGPPRPGRIAHIALS
jgi:hypothetical protein